MSDRRNLLSQGKVISQLLYSLESDLENGNFIKRHFIYDDQSYQREIDRFIYNLDAITDFINGMPDTSPAIRDIKIKVCQIKQVISDGSGKYCWETVTPDNSSNRLKVIQSVFSKAYEKAGNGLSGLGVALLVDIEQAPVQVEQPRPINGQNRKRNEDDYLKSLREAHFSKSLKEALIQRNSTRDKVTSDKLESDCLTLCSRVERIASKLESYIKSCTHEQSIDKHLAYYIGLSEGLHSAIDEINAVRIAAVDVIPELELVLMELEKVFRYGTMARIIVTGDLITGTMKRDDKLSIKSMRDDAICAYEKAGKYIVDLSNRLLVEVRHIIAQSQQAPAKKSKKQKSKKKTPPQLLKETRERHAVNVIAKDQSITAERLGEILGCDKSTVTRLQAWKNKGVIRGDVKRGHKTKERDGSSTIDAIYEHKYIDD